MFSKILVANRGEIACRIFRTARRLGIATVAVYCDADKNALHVKMADEAVHLGPAPAGKSYLVIDKIIDACRKTGADAVHPGYGFLSERAEFASRLAAGNITFIGPPPAAIAAMGDKINSRKIAADANIPTVPGFTGLIEEASHAVTIAREIGYPVMIKASAGGGGKGMRIAFGDGEAREGFERARSEAASSFGDDRIFIEKYIEQPRHIEIQLLADSHGNCIHLGERECSIQRRHQKIIEEAPSPFLDEATRQAMGAQSCALARAVGYTSAGTVEFILDKDRNFYFLEMNTRLQVEHPVTELITGVDLVEQMIHIAAGNRLDFTQDDITLTGWAMESRLYAEDPCRDFLPSAGRLTCYRPPAEGPVELDAGGPVGNNRLIRNDSGVCEGDEISIFYDPMIAKLCSWGENRTTAIGTMAQALDMFQLEGIAHNLAFCAAVMKHPRFRSGDISTAFIAEEYPDGFAGVMPDENECIALAAFAAVMRRADEVRAARLTGSAAFLPASCGPVDYVVTLAGQSHAITVHNGPGAADGTFQITIGPQDKRTTHRIFCSYAPGRRKFLARAGDFPGGTGASYFLQAKPVTGGYHMRNQGADLNVQVLSPRMAELAALMPEKQPADSTDMLVCPMPGLVVKLLVEEGDTVEEGQALAIVEAMKMENTLRAARSGVISSVRVKKGDSLSVDEVILEFACPSDDSKMCFMTGSAQRKQRK